MCARCRGTTFACACLALLGAQLLSGCGSGNGNALSGQQAHRMAGLEFALFSDQQVYAPGQIVPLTFTVTNVTDASIVFTTMNAGGDIFNFYVTRANQAVSQCFSGSGGQVETVTFAPGTPVAFTCGWDQTGAPAGTQVAPGGYEVRASLCGGTVDGVLYTPQQAQAELAANPIQVTIASH